MKNAVLGAYVSREGVLHAIDARVKMFVLLLATIVLFAKAQLALLLGACALAAVLLVLSHMSMAALGRAIRPLSVVLIFSLVANACVVDGTADIAVAGQFGISLAGATRGFVAVVRIVTLLELSLVLSATTTVMQLSEAVGWLLAPLSFLGLPTQDISMALAVSLRLIPVCVAEFDRIVVAQKARGAQLTSPSLRIRLKSWANVLTALLVVLFSHADKLGDAMCDRCYGTAKRTSLVPALSGASKMALLIAIVVTVVVLVVL